MTEGIWWDSSAERKTMLWREFGHLAGLKGRRPGGASALPLRFRRERRGARYAAEGAPRRAS